jgi:four helix bundle protein
MSASPGWDLKNLVAWPVSMDFAAAIHIATRDFPDDERFGLRMQLRRAAVSVPSNIVHFRRYQSFLADISLAPR